MFAGQLDRFRRRKAVVLFAFLHTLSIWLFHDKFWLMVIPRYFPLDVMFNSFPWMKYDDGMILRLVVMRITSHLSGLKCICQSRSQYCKLLRSSWRDVVSSLVLMCRYRRQSSANNLAVLFTLLGRSLMYIKNSSGSRTVPWGTPEVKCAGSDSKPSTITLWVRPARKLLIQFKVGPRIP